MLINTLIIYAVLGISTGILGGLLGISGGVITVPCLLLIFSLLGMPSEFLMQMAIGTSLAAMVFNTFSSCWAHHRRGGVVWHLVWMMMPGIILGAIIGAWVANYLSTDVLQIIFAIFAIAIGIFFMIPRRTLPEARREPNVLMVSLLSLPISAVSNLLGIGGGIFTVPMLITYHLTERVAIGTSTAVGFTITTIGALSYLYWGWGQSIYPNTIGYIYLPAFLMIGVSTFFAAPYGAKLAHVLPPKIIRRLLGGALLIIGALMLFGGH